MIEFFAKLFDTSDFPERWNCGTWTAGHGWLHIISDLLVWGAYTAIPVVLAIYILRRRDLYFPGIFWLFGLFILSCGAVHLVEALIFWIPIYRVSGLIKLVTAIVSWATVIALIRIAPEALKLPSLKGEIRQKEQVAADLREQLRAAVVFERVSQVANKTHSKSELLQHSAEAITELTGLERVHIWELNSSGQAFQLTHVEGGAVDDHPNPVPVDSFVGIVNENRPQPKMIRDRDGGFIPQDQWAITEGLKGFVSYPILRDEDQLIGLVEVFTREPMQARTARLLIPTIDVVRTGYLRIMAERAQRLLIEQLRARNLEIADRNAELDEFAYVASHDLRAPLRAIDSLAKMIVEDESGALSEPGQQKLDLLQQRVQRMNQLLDDLLAYSRIGRKGGKLSDVDTGKLVEEVIDLLGVRDRARFQIEGPLPTIHCDPMPLKHIFQNLIDNAIKHHGEEGDSPLVTIRCQEETDYFAFCFEDNGPGIDPVFHKKIFKMFETLRPRDEVEGSGMGLALIKKYAITVGGSIQVQSKLGEGCRFILRWPKLQTAP